MKIYEEVTIDMNPESSTYEEHLSEESYNYEGDVALAGGSIGDLFHRPGGYSWHASKEWEDPSTGVTYQTAGRKKKGGLFGFGGRHKVDQSKIKGRGLAGEQILGEREVKQASGLGQQMIQQAEAVGAGFGDEGQEGFGMDMGLPTAMMQRQAANKWAPDRWIEGLKKTTGERWEAPGAKQFSMDDPESIKKWIRNITPGGGEKEGTAGAENWFQQQSQALKRGMGDVNLEELVSKKGDIMQIAEEKEGAGVGQFLDVARGLGESLGEFSAFDPSKHGGQFLKYMTTGQALPRLLDEMKGRLATYEEEEGEEREQFQREGALRGEQTREQIADIQGGPYVTGRQETQIEGLLENLRADQAKARESYESTESDIWRTHISGETGLGGLASEWAGIETSNEGY